MPCVWVKSSAISCAASRVLAATKTTIGPCSLWLFCPFPHPERERRTSTPSSPVRILLMASPSATSANGAGVRARQPFQGGAHRGVQAGALQGGGCPHLPRAARERVELPRCGAGLAELRDLFPPQDRRIHFIHGKCQRIGRQSLQRQVGAQDAGLFACSRDSKVFPHVL